MGYECRTILLGRVQKNAGGREEEKEAEEADNAGDDDDEAEEVGVVVGDGDEALNNKPAPNEDTIVPPELDAVTLERGEVGVIILMCEKEVRAAMSFSRCVELERRNSSVRKSFKRASEIA